LIPQVKIFLNASSAIRAQRRHAELQAAGTNMPYEQVLHDIESRDAADYSRPVGALKKVRMHSRPLSLTSARMIVWLQAG
jgi:cytidylate kinase